MTVAGRNVLRQIGKIVKKFFSFLLLAGVAGGVIWYENRPTTVTIPVETSDPVGYYEEPTTTVSEVTDTKPSRPKSDFSKADLTLEVHGLNGDDITLREIVGKPKHLDALPADVEAMVRTCSGVTDRDMVVPIEARLELNSSLSATVSVDYRTLLMPAVYEFSSGLACDEGRATHELEPGRGSRMRYWVVLSGAVTPDYPDGDFRSNWTVDTPVLTLPNMEPMKWKLWGPKVMNCARFIGDRAEVLLSGPPAEGCTIVDDKQAALTNA